MKVSIVTESSHFNMTASKSDDKKTSLVEFSGKLTLDEIGNDTLNELISRVAGLPPFVRLTDIPQKPRMGNHFDDIEDAIFNAKDAGAPYEHVVRSFSQAMEIAFPDRKRGSEPAAESAE